MESLRYAIDSVVLANRILFREKVVDGMGHVSVRHPENPELFLLSCSRAPGLVKRQDIRVYDFDGNEKSLQGKKPYSERFIHSEIFRRRPDVHSVVHSHSESVIPFGVTHIALKPIFHMAGFLGKGVGHFDIGETGDTDMLIRNSYLGSLLAKTLDGKCCVLMRGHGSTTVGSSIMQAVYRAIYTEVNSRLQLLSSGLGEVQFLSPGEAALSSDMMDDSMERPFQLWQESLGEIDYGEWPEYA
jgi:ribulose-5-phosphate 4-epimerase/fuculose-1-phosphate aldolase